jgi:hypothetical protein
MAALYTYAPILKCVQDALAQLAQESPLSAFGSADEHAKLMVSYANQIGIFLTESEDWQQLITLLTLTGDSVRTAFDLPADMSRIISDTGWSAAHRRPVVVVNAQQQAEIRAWASGSFFVNPACRLMGDQLVFLTPPATGEVITFEYISKNWVLDGDAVTLKSALVTDADTPRFDSVLFTIVLKLRWLQARGMPTGSVQDEFNRRYLQVTSRDNMAQVLSLNGGTMVGMRYLDGYNVPDTGLGF